jgi:hypothetical protein
MDQSLKSSCLTRKLDQREIAVTQVQASVFDDVATMEARTTSLALPRQQAKLARGTKDMEAIAEAVQRPTMKFVATKTADQLDLQALHRLDERLVRSTLKTHRDSGRPGSAVRCQKETFPIATRSPRRRGRADCRRLGEK